MTIEEYAEFWRSRWLPDLAAVLVSMENVPHPVHCAVWDEDGCDCGMEAGMALLYPLVGATPDGRVEPDGHPLRVARLIAYKRSLGLPERPKRRGWFRRG